MSQPREDVAQRVLATSTPNEAQIATGGTGQTACRTRCGKFVAGLARVGEADRLESMLTAAGVEHDIKVYPGAGHGFLNDHDPAELPIW